jgi:light-regulated signal transduction histidine kinase (bacteriophytochrome)
MGYPSDHVLIGESVLPFGRMLVNDNSIWMNCIKHGSITSYQIRAKRKNDQPSTLLISAHLIREEDGTPVRIEGVVLDITARIEQEEKILATQKELQRLLDEAEQSRRALLNIVEDQKQAQMEIRRLNKDLEERVAKRTAQLRTSNEELESFAYSISHDLRAPLRAIDGYSLILAQDYSDKLDEEGHRLLNIIRSSTRNMDNLITHLLSLSRVGRTELKYEKIDMTKMVETVFKEIASSQEMEKIEFHLTLLPTVMADSSLIRQVWINLISNAIKYSAPKEKPQINISGKKEKGFCTYRIEDNGVGFNPDSKKIFSPCSNACINPVNLKDRV